MQRLFLLGLISAMLTACGPNEVTEVKSTYPSGEKKVEYILVPTDTEEFLKVGERHYYENGQIELEGRYDKKGKRQGRWKYWYPNGKLWSMCDYTSGLKDGESKVYFENGEVRYYGKYNNDEKIGTWRFYDESGQLTNEITH